MDESFNLSEFQDLSSSFRYLYNSVIEGSNAGSTLQQAPTFSTSVLGQEVPSLSLEAMENLMASVNADQALMQSLNLEQLRWVTHGHTD
jgi:hypothetical protein